MKRRISVSTVQKLSKEGWSIYPEGTKIHYAGVLVPRGCVGVSKLSKHGFMWAVYFATPRAKALARDIFESYKEDK